MISIVTACYNSSKTISKTIESLLAQTDTNFEHIIIDGESKDNTIEIVQSYSSEYEKKGINLIVISEKDEGLYDALNKGIAISNGDYIGILNADDWYESRTVEIVHNNMEDDIDIIMGASCTINADNKSIKKPGQGRIITSRHFNHGGMFVRKECYQTVGVYANDGNYYDDFMWYIKALKNQRRFKLIDDVLHNFVCGGMSTKKSFREMIRRIDYRYACYRKNDCSRLYIIECIVMELGKYFLIKE